MSAGDNNQNGIYGTATSNSITIGNSNNDIYLNMNTSTGTYQIWNTPTTVAPNNAIWTTAPGNLTITPSNSTWTITSPSHIKNSYIELPIGLLVKIKDFKSFLGIYLLKEELIGKTGIITKDDGNYTCQVFVLGQLFDIPKDFLKILK